MRNSELMAWVEQMGEAMTLKLKSQIWTGFSKHQIGFINIQHKIANMYHSQRGPGSGKLAQVLSYLP
jgi:hypothetical protein